LKAPPLFAGIFATFALSWFGMVMIPQAQIGNLQPQVDEENNDAYPVSVSGIADAGRRVYAANGCIYCHTQQVREEHSGGDIARGWGQGAGGARRTVARDYLYERPTLLGSTRTGPDLSNAGWRQPSAEWHYLHLYDPPSVTPGSNMPPFRFLFEKRKISGQRAANALTLWGTNKPEDGYEVVPTNDAKVLVGYLLSLDHSHPLKEAAGAPQEAPPAPAASPAAAQPAPAK
jgi:cytochrome c oxidase cbb3-type subunit 2